MAATTNTTKTIDDLPTIATPDDEPGLHRRLHGRLPAGDAPRHRAAHRYLGGARPCVPQPAGRPPAAGTPPSSPVTPVRIVCPCYPPPQPATKQSRIPAPPLPRLAPGN